MQPARRQNLLNRQRSETICLECRAIYEWRLCDQSAGAPRWRQRSRRLKRSIPKHGCLLVPEPGIDGRKVRTSISDRKYWQERRRWQTMHRDPRSINAKKEGTRR